MDAESAATEVVPVGRHPLRVLKATLLVLLGHLPERLHNRIAFSVRALSAAVHSRSPGVDEVDDSRGGLAGEFLAGHPLDSLRAPVRPHVGEDLRTVGQQVRHQHSRTIERVVLRRENRRLPASVPVEVGVQKGLGEVPVRHPVRPLTLSLETSGDGVVTESLLLESHLAELRIAVHKIHHDDGHLHHELPVLVLLLTGLLLTLRVLVPALVRHTVFLDPCHSLLELLRIVYSKIHTPQDLDLIDAFVPHSQIFLEEVGVHDGAGDAHCHASDRKVGLPSHLSHRDSATGETENLLGHILRDRVVLKILDIVAVDSESRKALLGVRGKYCRKINRSRTLRAVESPDSLRPVRIHIHSLGAVAPAGCHGDRSADSLTLEFLGAGCALSHTADRTVSDDTLHRSAVCISQIRGNEGSDIGRKGHCLFLKTFTYTALTAIYGRTDSYFRMLHNIGVLMFMSLKAHPQSNAQA